MWDGLLACLPLELRLVLRSLTTQKYAISLFYSFPFPSSTNNIILILLLSLLISFNKSYSYSYFEVSTNILTLCSIYPFSSNHSFYNFKNTFIFLCKWHIFYWFFRFKDSPSSFLINDLIIIMMIVSIFIKCLILVKNYLSNV